MWKRTLVTIGLLSAACLTMEAQSQNEEGELNFFMGGGLSVPLNPIARFVGVGGSFLGGGGYNIDQHSSIVGQFQWDGLRPSVGAIAQLNGISQERQSLRYYGGLQIQARRRQNLWLLLDRRRRLVLSTCVNFEEHFCANQYRLPADLDLVWLYLQRRIR